MADQQINIEEMMRKWAELLKRTDTRTEDVPLTIGPSKDGTWFVVTHSLSTHRCFQKPDKALEYVDKYLR